MILLSFIIEHPDPRNHSPTLKNIIFTDGYYIIKLMIINYYSSYYYHIQLLVSYTYSEQI